MTAPILDRPVALLIAGLYFAVVAVIGLWSARRTRSARDFFIAGQRPGLLVVGMATVSAAFSGFVFLGGAGLTYRIGAASLWIVLPIGFTGGLLCWVVGARLRRLAGIREIFTVPDAIQARYGSRWVTGLAAAAIAIGAIAYLGLQIQALAVLFRAMLGTSNLHVAMLLALVILVGYSVIGGMVAGIYTDVLQGTLMILVAVAVFLCAVRGAGGWAEMTASIAGSDAFGPKFLDPLGRAPAMTAFGFFFVFGVGVLGQPHMLHKFFMIDDPRKLRWLPLVMGAGQALCVLIWLGVGFAVPALVAQGRLAPLAAADDAAPAFLLGFVGAPLAGLAFAGILAAIMSTADSFLNVGAAALVRDLPRAFGRPVRDELSHGRAAVLLIAILASAGAWYHGDLIALLGTFAFGTFAAALAPALAVGFCWDRVGSRAAGASIATGLSVHLGLELATRQGWSVGEALPSGIALAASFTVLFLVTAFSRPASRVAVDDEVLEIVRS